MVVAANQQSTRITRSKFMHLMVHLVHVPTPKPVKNKSELERKKN